MFTVFQTHAQQIVKAEYFFSPDPGVGNGTDIPLTPGDSVNLNFMADFSGLEPGYYTVFVRIMDENGVWSLTGNRYLIVQSPQITEPVSSAEYFFDEDPGAGNGFPINFTSADSVDVTETISTGDLEPGLHILYVRSKDENGSWSSMGSWPVYAKAPDKTGSIVKAEYFFDEDPGIGNGFQIPLTSTDTLDLNIDIPVPDTLSFGPHRIYLRTQSTDSLWTHYAGWYIEVCDTYGAVADYNFQLGSDRWASFTDQSEYAGSWLWDFDDGNTDTAQNPVHQYTLPGIYEVKQYAINDCWTDTMEQQVVIRGIFSVESNRGGNTGSVTFHLNGFGFTAGSLLSLTREGFDPILPDTFSIQNDQTIYSRFDLSGKDPGFWNVEVELPGDTTFIEVDGFEILEGGSPDLQVTMDGRRRVLFNRDNNFLIKVENRGLEDAVAVPLILRNINEIGDMNYGGIDKNDFWTDPFYSDLNSYVLTNSLDSSLIDFNFIEEDLGTKAAAFVIPYIPAGSTVQFPIKIKFSVVGEIDMGVTVAPQGYLTSSSLLLSNPVAEPLNCRSGEFRSALEMAMDTTFSDTDWEDCFADANTSALEYLRETGINNDPGNSLLSYQGINGVILYEISSCLLGSEPDTALFKSAMMLLNKRFNTMDLNFDEPEDCNAISYDNLYNYQNWESVVAPQKSNYPDDLVSQIFNPLLSPKDGCVMCGVRHCMGCATFVNIDGVGSLDPNAKYGPGSNPYDNYLNDSLRLNYSIYFENVDTATAPAGMVRIADSLDPEKYELATFKFGSFGFNSHVYNGLQEDYQMLAVYDLRPERPVYLKVEASLDTATGFAEWTFSSLDTLSLQLTDDPDAGFLLPNVNHPEGEGFVSFDIELKEDLIAGETIDNDAEVIFDLNEPIVTDVWSNIFDNDLPESEVLALPDTIFNETFTLAWEGSDPTSGVRYFDIYASTIGNNDTTQSIWRFHTGETSAEFTGSFGEKYYFYSIATDSARNVEPGVVVFDVEVVLYDPCLDPTVVNHFYEVCAGDSANIQGTWQTEPGLYFDTLSTIYGCDSVIISDLTVWPLPDQPVISWDGTTLSSTPAESYQWYKDDEVIAGATEQTYIPEESGMYKVEISDENGCLVFSDPFDVILSVIDVQNFTLFKIYPNPTNGFLHIENLESLEINVEIWSPMGELLQKRKYDNSIMIDFSNYQKGLYQLRIITNRGVISHKIIVN